MRAGICRDGYGLFYGIRIFCPGCRGNHVMPVRWLPPGEVEESPSVKGMDHWDFNGDFEKPTFSPSLLVRGGRFLPENGICHSFIRNGKIEYLNDCSHEWAGKVFELLKED